jgi:hypothetical protein
MKLIDYKKSVDCIEVLFFARQFRTPFFLSFCFLKANKLEYTNIYLCLQFCVGVNVGPYEVKGAQ